GGSVVSTPVHTGTKALQGNVTASDFAQCSQNVAVVPNTAYTVSTWVRGGGGYVYLSVTGGSSTWNPATAHAWPQRPLSCTTAAGQPSLQVYVHGWYGQPAYNADDVSVDGPGGSSPPPSSPPPAGAPSVPGNFRVTGSTASSISVAWNASTGTVTGYRVYQGTTVAGDVTGPSPPI